MKTFWNIVLPEQDDTPADLFLEGEIAEDTWYGDEVTPAQFRADLAKASGRDVTVWINSPGGDVFAASMIYTALMEHKGHVTVKVEGLAASAASVIAMAGERVLMAPTSFMMIHNPWSLAIGNADAMRHEAEVLDEIAEGLITAYHIKTSLSKAKLRQLMDDETWMSAQTAIDLGFADAMLTRSEAEPAGRPDEAEEDGEDEGEEEKKPTDHAHVMFGRVAACNRTRQRIGSLYGNSKHVHTDRYDALTFVPWRQVPPKQPESAPQEARDAFLARMQDAAAKIHIDQ